MFLNLLANYGWNKLTDWGVKPVCAPRWTSWPLFARSKKLNFNQHYLSLMQSLVEFLKLRYKSKYYFLTPIFHVPVPLYWVALILHFIHDRTFTQHVFYFPLKREMRPQYQFQVEPTMASMCLTQKQWRVRVQYVQLHTVHAIIYYLATVLRSNYLT